MVGVERGFMRRNRFLLLDKSEFGWGGPEVRGEESGRGRVVLTDGDSGWMRKDNEWLGDSDRTAGIVQRRLAGCR